MSVPSFHSLRSTEDGDSTDSLSNLRAMSETVRHDSPRTAYSKLRNAREQATFNLMMRMDPSALAKIRQEFYSRNDEVSLTDFIYIMYKHLIELAEPDLVISQKHQDTRSFVSDMNELFKEVDVNGDSVMEWEEFTKFTVEKASLLNQKFVMATIPEYVESTASLDPSIRHFRRHDIGRMLPMPSIGCFSVLEEHSKDISVYYSLNGRHATNIRTDAVPLAIDFAKDTSVLFASCSNLQINMYQQLPNKRFQFQGSIPTIDTQMSLAWMSTNEVLYSGSELGVVNCWKPSDKSLLASMTTGHNDICMKLLALDQLDNLVSASMDSTIGVWDTYTNSIITKLKGHRKGVFEMSYNPDYRLLFSCGFDHDAFVWSPFVNSLVFKLKGHHASLVGCHSVENSPEVLTADEDGVFKLWDIRTFQCVQTFFHNSSMDSNEPAEHLSCFFHQNIPTSHRGDEGGEARIYAGSRRIRSFDQKRIVHQRTTDFTNVIWMSINCESFLIFTASDRNLIVWDLLLGSKMIIHNNICGEEISACCVDNRQRKIIIGDIHGHINVYNPLTGAFMKSCPHDINSIVTSLIYLADGRRFIAGYACAVIRIYDESKLDDCFTIRTFEINLFQPELTIMTYCSLDRSILTTSSIGQSLKIWDFDTGKLDSELDVCTSPHGVIVAVAVLDPFPLILASDSLGNLSLWGSRGCKWKGNLITTFANINPLHSEYEEQKKADVNGIPPQRILAKDEFSFRRQLTTISTAKSKGDGSDDQEVKEEQPHDIRDPSVDDFRLCEEKWGKVSAATTLTWAKDSYDLYTGDELGYIRKWSFKQVIEELGGMAMIHGHKSADILPNRSRRGGRNANAVTPLQSSNINYIMGKFGNVAECSVKFRWALQGHNETIIACVMSADGILTSSTDSLVKMWTFDGILIGILLHNILTGMKSLHWNISIDLDAVRAQEELELDHLMDQLHQIQEEKKKEKKEKGNKEEFELELSETESAVAEAKFSRSTLRKRIDMSSKILGLDFTNDIQQLQRSGQPQSYDPRHKQQQEKQHPSSPLPQSISFPSSSLLHSSSDDVTVMTALTDVGSLNNGPQGTHAPTNSTVTMEDDDNLSFCSANSSSQQTFQSKNTKDAIDESKNIFHHTSSHLIITKKKSCSVAQLRRSEQTMQKMAEKYLQKGIKLPILTSTPKSTEFFPVITSISSSSYSSARDKSRRKMSKKKGLVGMAAHENDSVTHQTHQQAALISKCSKYSSYENLEKSLHISMEASASSSSFVPSASPSSPTSLTYNGSLTTEKITERLRQRQQRMIDKLQSEKKHFSSDDVKSVSSSGGLRDGLDAEAPIPMGGVIAGGGADVNENRRVSKFENERKLSKVDPLSG